MKHHALLAEERTVLGKNVKKLRREGILPANVYGKSLASLSIQVKLQDFQAVYKEVGETGIIDLTVNGKVKPVLVKSMQVNFPSYNPLHVDFYQVNLKENVKATIPVTVVGEPLAVIEKEGILLQLLNEVEVEALPDKLPEHLEASVEHLAAVGESVTVGDLKTPEGVTILTDAGQVVANIGAPTVAEVEPEEEEVVEGEAPAEGEEAEATEEGAEEKPAESAEEKTEE